MLDIGDLKTLKQLTNEEVCDKRGKLIKEFNDQRPAQFHDAIIEFELAVRLNEKIDIMKTQSEE